MDGTANRPIPGVARSESALWAGLLTVVLFTVFGNNWLADLSSPLWYSFLFLWLFVVMLWLAFGVVRHADSLAIRLGEPYGTLILTVSVISIEVIMISAVMLTGAGNPTVACDTLLSVLMIVLNGMLGLTLLLGGLRHREQSYNLQGAAIYLAVIIPLAGLGLDQANVHLLLITMLVAMVNFTTPRTNVLHGVVHLVFFMTYVVLIFD